MARYQSLISITLLCTILVVINSTTQVMCHTKGLRPGRHMPINPFPENSTRTQLIEKRFLKWVQFIGGLDHSVFKQALNKLFPSYSITVDKNPAAGDFTSIQAALDSLPLINLVRVVIKVNAGTYTEKVSVSPMRAFVTIQGAGADKTVVQWGDTANTLGSRGQPIGTFNSATFAVNSAFFIARNITFKVVYAYLKQSNCNAVS